MGDGGVFVQTSAEPVGYEVGVGEWFPEEFLPTVGPVPRRRLVDWLLGTRPTTDADPRPGGGPEPTTDADAGADRTSGSDGDADAVPDTRPGGGPEPTTDADGSSGPGTAHNPTTGPGDAPGPPRT